MKHFINVFVLLVLIVFIIGTTYLQINYGRGWFISYIPLIMGSIAWLIKLTDDY